MKVITYHNVRPAGQIAENQFALEIKNFGRQLDYFLETSSFVSRSDLTSILSGHKQPSENAILLTFDDGLSDHINFVLPELKKRNLYGIFFVCSNALEQTRLLDVHRIHYLLSKMKADDLLSQIETCIDDSDIQKEYKNDILEFSYPNQGGLTPLVRVKQLLNYGLKPVKRQQYIDRLFQQITGLDEKKLSKATYLSPDQVRFLADQGMLIGVHTASHPVMSYLSKEMQKREIEESLISLEVIVGPLAPKLYCHPYGGKYTYSQVTIDVLKDLSFDCGFSMNPNDVTQKTLLHNRFDLPRYDCITFAHGASYSRQR